MSLVMFVIQPAARADDRQIDALVRAATGIDKSDYESALKKKELSLFDAYALAVRNTETFKIESEKTIQADARRSQAIGGVLPRISLRGNYVFPSNPNSSSSTQRSAVSLYGKQPITTGLDEWTKISRSRSDYKVSELDLRHYAGRMLIELSNSFFNIHLLSKSISNRKEILGLYYKTLGELQRRFSIGKSRESEQLRTRTEMYRLEASIKSLEKDLCSAKISFAAMVDRNFDFTLIEGGPLKEPEFSITGARGIAEKRWDVMSAKESVDGAKANLIAAYGGHVPTIYLEGFVGLYSEMSSSINAYGNLGFEVPIFSGGITAAKTREMQSQLRQTDLRYKNIFRKAEQEIIDSYQNYKNSLEEVKFYKQAYESARRNYYSIMNEYSRSLVTILDVLTVLTNLQQAQDDFERAELQNRIYRIRLGVAANEMPGSGVKILQQEKNQQKEE